MQINQTDMNKNTFLCQAGQRGFGLGWVWIFSLLCSFHWRAAAALRARAERAEEAEKEEEEEEESSWPRRLWPSR